jgi:helicase MOV-10
MHQALETVFHPERVIFPGISHAQNLRPPSAFSQEKLTLFNKMIGQNPPQLLAVSCITELPKGSPPFIVFGP